MIIDSHHHFWKYNLEEFNWIDDEMKTIRRDFLPNDLKKILDKVGIDGVISVQARQKIEETDWLLTLAEQYDFIKGVTGWLPLFDKKIESYLEKYSNNKNLKALRHVIQDEPDDNFILRDDFNEGIRLLKQFDLPYEILIFEKHLPQAIRFVDRHPQQIFILDHMAKPRIKDKLFSPWKENIRQLAKRENVHCKISGMVTEANPKHWTYEELKPYFEIILDTFGPNRLMFGSDWPVCLTATTYQQWFEVVKRFIQELSSSEQAALLGNNAIKIYQLNKP